MIYSYLCYNLHVFTFHNALVYDHNSCTSCLNDASKSCHVFIIFVDTKQLNQVNNSTNATAMTGNLMDNDNAIHKHTLIYIGGSCVFVFVLIIIIIVVIFKMRRSPMHMLKYTDVKRVIVMRPVSRTAPSCLASLCKRGGKSF